MNISVVINTLNEESNLPACIESVRGIAGEIIVCDMHSDDRTGEIAREAGAKLIFHERMGFVEPARRYAISHAQYPWVLVIDADERMTPKLAERLCAVVVEDRVDVVQFGILYNYFGGYVRHGGFYDIHFPRFFRKETYLSTYQDQEAEVHQNFLALREKAQRVLQLTPDFFLLHEAYPTVEKYISKTLGMYAGLEAKQRVAQGQQFSRWRILWEPVQQFLARFIKLHGYRDGWRGFILAVLYSGFRFAVWANIWLLTQKTQAAPDQNR